jgi:hypothetical protein
VHTTCFLHATIETTVVLHKIQPRVLLASAIAGQFLALAEAFRYFIMSEGSAALTWISMGVGLFLTAIAVDIWRRRVITLTGRLKLAGKVFFFYALTLSVVAVVFVEWNRYERKRYEAHKNSPLTTLSADVSPSAELRAFLAQPENFSIQSTISAIPASVRVAFAKRAHQETFAMAEPGADWNESDDIKPGLSFCRLGKVALSKSLCILFYEQGGFGWSSHADVFEITPDGATLIWRAYAFQTITGPSDLLAAIDSGRLEVSSQ